MARVYYRLAAAGTAIIKAGPPNTHVSLMRLVMTATAQSTITFTDTVNTFVVDVGPGVNPPFHIELPFAPDKDVTLTAAGGTVSVYADTVTH